MNKTINQSYVVYKQLAAYNLVYLFLLLFACILGEFIEINIKANLLFFLLNGYENVFHLFGLSAPYFLLLFKSKGLPNDKLIPNLILIILQIFLSILGLYSLLFTDSLLSGYL